MMISDCQVDARPSRVRYFVLALTTMVAALLYLDRICLSFAERYVKDDLRISDAQMGLVLSSFFWAYALGQLPAGWLSDRYGARLMLALFLAVWSAFTGLLGLAYSLTILVLLRLGCGLFEAGAYPAAAGLISKWMPFQRRGFASGIVSVGGRLGGAAAPIVTAYLMVAFVPVSTSSLLGADDLLDVSHLIPVPSQTATPQADFRTEVTRKVWQRLPEDTRRRLAASQESKNNDPAFAAHLASDLNSVLGQADLIDGVKLSGADLSVEAVRLAQSSGTLSPEEIQRRNRLVLEAALPDGIRKIYGSGWRPVMMVYGIAGLAVAGIFWWFFRDSPRRHPACNAAEIALIEGEGGPVDPKATTPPLPFTCLLESIGLWLSSVVQFLTNFGWAFLITWFPRYLKEAHDVPLVERGWMTSMPIFVGMAGMFWGGWLTDYMVAQMGPKWGRSLPLSLSRFAVAGAFIACIFLHTPWQVTVALAVVALGTDLGTPAIWAYSLDVGGKHVGAVLGWSNMFGNLGAALSPILLNMIIGDKHYDRMFLTCAGAFVLAGVSALFIDATQPVVPAKRLVA
jgi:sugar phosphate permease